MEVAGSRNHVLTKLATLAEYCAEPVITQAMALYKTALASASNAPVSLTCRSRLDNARDFEFTS